jgi:regulatory protein
LDLLSARAYSAKELRRKLVQKEVAPEEADRVIERLTEAGLIDDTKYALSYTRSKLLGSGASARRIKQELGRKGICGEIAGEAVEQVIADEEIDTRAVVERVAKKKLASMGDLEPLVLRRRLYGFLARKGYDIDEIQSVMQTLFR